MDLLHFKDNASNRDVISLFSGAMGLDIGLAKAGLNIVIGQDFDPACVATMRANGHKVLGGDIREIDEADLLEQTGWRGGSLSSFAVGLLASHFPLLANGWGSTTPGVACSWIYPND